MKSGERAPIKAAAGPTRERLLDTTILRDATEFASLKEDWDELYQSCPSATPFQSWEWLYSWWEAYEEGYGLRLITLRDESGLLVGLLPLMVRRGRLLLLGGDRVTLYNPITPHKDILVREGWEEPVARAGVRALKEMDGWQVADLQELMPESATWEIFHYWEGPKASVPIADYVLVHAKSWDELLSSLSKSWRNSARRSLRRVAEDGLKCKPAAPEDAGRAARRLIDLYRELFQGRRIDPESLTPRYEAFIEAAARRMSARGIGRVSEFRRQDGEVLVSQFLLFDKDFVGVYIIGASDEAIRRYQFMTLCNWDAMNVAQSRGSTYVSWMYYVSQDKLRWASEVVSSHSAILGRSRAFWAPYAGYLILRDRYYVLRSQTQTYLHSESVPRWVKKGTERYYALQSYLHSDSAPRWVKKATEKYYALRYEYGYYALQYKYELAQVRRQIRRSNASHTPAKKR